MAKKRLIHQYEARKFEAAIEWLRQHGFEIRESGSGAVVRKYGCEASVERDERGAVRFGERPGYVIGGETAKLVDHGYQKFFTTSKTEVAATADHLRALHQFTEELKESTGLPSLYNESIGTVSDSYHYDRIVGRDEPAAARKPRPWERA